MSHWLIFNQGEILLLVQANIFKNILYGFGAWIIVIRGFSVNTLISYQVLMLFLFLLVAHKSIPSKDVF